MNHPDKQARCIAIHPTAHGLGYAVLEEDATLVDWGAYRARGDKNQKCLLFLATLVSRYDPTVVFLESRGPRDRKRVDRIAGFVRSATALIRRSGVPAAPIRRGDVLKFFARHGATTKRAIALKIVEWFPELSAELPPRRKAWKSEHPRMGMFEALAIALTYFDL
ncbi:MAG TPA: hypothetical protein VI306_09900 [Pyrinomonadaceae bacterium]